MGNWCWAAAGQMVMEYHQVLVSECQQASDQFRLNCCPNNDLCNQGGWPDFSKYGFTFNKTKDKALGWDVVRDQIYCKRLPFTFAWHDGGSGGHIFVAIGYQTKDGGNYVEMHDSQPYREPTGIGGDHAIIPYLVYSSGLPGTSHWDDYYEIKKR